MNLTGRLGPFSKTLSNVLRNSLEHTRLFSCADSVEFSKISRADIRMAHLSLDTLSISPPDFSKEIESQLGPSPKIEGVTLADEEAIERLELFAKFIESKGPTNQWLVCEGIDLHASVRLQAWKFSKTYYTAVMLGKFLPVVDKHLPTFPRRILANSLVTSGRKVVLRDYDCRFSSSELDQEQWGLLETESAGPYDITVKESGALILISQHPGVGLLMSDVKGLGKASANREAAAVLLERQLGLAGKQRYELLEFLKRFDVTLVCSLCDDSLEEHILPHHTQGLVLSGINHNTLLLKTWPKLLVAKIARHFGFSKPLYQTKATLAQVRGYLQQCVGYFDGHPIETLVVSCTSSKAILFECSFDHPRALYLDWHRHTLRALKARDKSKLLATKCNHLTADYIRWLVENLDREPKNTLFESYRDGKGIGNARSQFFKDTGHSPTSPSLLGFSTGKYSGVVLVPVGGRKEASVLGDILSKIFPSISILKSEQVSNAGLRRAIVAKLDSSPVVYVEASNRLASQRHALLTAILDRHPATALVSIQWLPSFDSLHAFEAKANAGLGHAEQPLAHTMLFLDGVQCVAPQIYPGDAKFTHHFSTTGALADLINNDITPVIQPFSATDIPPIQEVEAGVFSPKARPRQPTFFYTGIGLSTDLFRLIYAKIHSKEACLDFPSSELQEARSFLSELRPFPQSPASFDYHVTLTHNTLHEANAAYSEGGRASHWLDKPVLVEFDCLVWHCNGIMALSVKRLKNLFNPNEAIEATSDIAHSERFILTSNAHLHSTIGVLDRQMKAQDSNRLLAAFFGPLDPAWAPRSLAFDPPLSVLGRVQYFSTAPPTR